MRKVLKSQLNGKNKIHAIHTHALPVIRYPAGIISWLSEELRAADVKRRNLLTVYGGFHPKSSILRLYAKQRWGGQGLVSVRASIQEETAGLQEYTKKMAPTDDLLSEEVKEMYLPSWIGGSRYQEQHQKSLSRKVHC